MKSEMTQETVNPQDVVIAIDDLPELPADVEADIKGGAMAICSKPCYGFCY
jgi:hypothetical protein